MALDASDFRDRHGLRVLTGFVFAVAMAGTRLGWDGNSLTHIGAVILGFGVPIAVVLLWGERTRPKGNLAWTILTLLVITAFITSSNAGFNVMFLRMFPLGLYVGFYLLHDHPLTPTMMLSAVLLSSVFQGDIDWNVNSEGRAWGAAIAVTLGCAAAMLERERLQALVGTQTPWVWTGIRLAFIGVWTLLMLTFKEELQPAEFFANFGADPRGPEGRWFLVAILLVCLAIVALLFRSRKPRAQAP